MKSENEQAKSYAVMDERSILQGFDAANCLFAFEAPDDKRAIRTARRWVTGCDIWALYECGEGKEPEQVYIMVPENKEKQ